MKKLTIAIAILTICGSIYNINKAYADFGTVRGARGYPGTIYSDSFQCNQQVESPRKTCQNIALYATSTLDSFPSNSGSLDFYPGVDEPFNEVTVFDLACKTSDETDMEVGAYLYYNAGGGNPFHIFATSTNSFHIFCTGSLPSVTGAEYTFTFDDVPSLASLNAGSFVGIQEALYDINSQYANNSNVFYISENAATYQAAVLSEAPTGTPGANIEFYFPSDTNASSSIPDFTNWLVNVNNISDFNGQIRIDYSQYLSALGSATSSLNFRDTGATPAPQLPPYPVNKHHILWVTPMPIPSTWYARATYVDGSYTTSTPIQTFTISPNGTIPSFPSSGGTGDVPFVFTPIYEPTSTNLFQEQSCDQYTIGLFSSTTLPGVSCVIRNTFYSILNNTISSLQSLVTNALLTAKNAVLRIFPLNVFNTINDDLNALSATTTPQEITLVGHGTVFPGRTFVIMNSSTLSWIETYTGFDYKSFFDKVMYFVTGFIILGEAAALIRKIHDSVAGNPQ